MPLFGQQNLVPNPSFELIDDCSNPPPYSASSSWSVYNSSDYFNNICYPNSVPNNLFGNQYPSHGSSYTGVITYCPEITCGFSYRECLQAKLIDTLIKDLQYCVSYDISPADSVQYFSNNVSAYLSDTSLNFTGANDLFNATPQINLNSVVADDTTSWFQISELYKANGQEAFIIIGNFQNNSNTLVYPNPGPYSDVTAYYYIDNVKVYELPEIDAGTNQIIFPYESTTLEGNCEGCWNGLQYAWYPSVGLSDTTILNPIASPDVTTAYRLTLIDTTGNVPCMSDVIDSVTVFVEPGPNLVVFPNPSAQNESVNYYVGKVEGSNISILLHDLKGKLIHKKENIISDTEYKLDLRLAAGIYTLSLFSDNDLIETKKLVIEK